MTIKKEEKITVQYIIYYTRETFLIKGLKFLICLISNDNLKKNHSTVQYTSYYIRETFLFKGLKKI